MFSALLLCKYHASIGTYSKSKRATSSIASGSRCVNAAPSTIPQLSAFTYGNMYDSLFFAQIVSRTPQLGNIQHRRSFTCTDWVTNPAAIVTTKIPTAHRSVASKLLAMFGQICIYSTRDFANSSTPLAITCHGHYNHTFLFSIYLLCVPQQNGANQQLLARRYCLREQRAQRSRNIPRCTQLLSWQITTLMANEYKFRQQDINTHAVY